MAIFNFGGKQIDTTSATSAESLAKDLADAGVEIQGSIVLGNVYGVTGGTVTGDVKTNDNAKK